MKIIAYTLLVSGISAFSVDSPIHTLLLCRHGDSVWNGGESGTHERFTGWTDVPLSNKGRYEASAAAEQISTYSYEIDYCFTSHLGRALDTTKTVIETLRRSQKNLPPDLKDYRLNERHYGALQGYIKNEVEQGKYGHDPKLVKLWRRSWDIVPPLLDDADPRRIEEMQLFGSLCGGSDKVPLGESLEMVAKNRVRPFLDEVMTPTLNAVGKEKGRHDGSATGLVIAHANSLRGMYVTCASYSSALDQLTLLPLFAHQP
jgi:2,3-bisphosphoglycerate-dependent phosphoglycerate mutase